MVFFISKKPAVFILLCAMIACNESTRQTDNLPGSATPATDTPSSAPGPHRAGTAELGAKKEGMLTGTGIQDFVLDGYSILDTATGDLNGDAYADKLLLLKKGGEDTSSDVSEHPEKRPLLLLTGQAGGTYKLAARGDNTVLCVDCGGVMGDPYMQLVIKNSYFTAEMAGGSSWRWTRTVTFKYAPSEHNWFLFKDGHESYHSSEPDKVETKLYTAKDFGKVSFSQFDVYKDQ